MGILPKNGKDSAWDCEHHVDYDNADCVRDQILHNNVEFAGSKNLRSKYEFLILQFQDLGTNQSGHVYPSGNGKCSDNSSYTSRECHQEKDYNDKAWDSNQYLNNTLHNSVYLSPEKSGNSTVKNTYNQIQDCSYQCNHKGNSGSHPGTYPQVTSKLVSTKNVCCTWKSIYIVIISVSK